MSLVMVVDDMAMIREPIAAALRNRGYETVCAGDGKQALNAIESKLPDLILLDLSMPGMDGLGVLRELRGRPKTAHTPVILLTASADKKHIITAARWGVRDYLLKTGSSLSELLTRVGKYLPPPDPPHGPETHPQSSADRPAESSGSFVKPKLAASRSSGEIPPLLDRKQCFERVEQTMQGRTLSGVVAQVIALAASPRGDLSDLTTLIGRDPVLSARVLQAANSVSYASTRGIVSTLAEAVRNIGCAAVRDIAASLGVFDAMPPSEPDGFNPIRCWQHSFAVATLCNRLAPGDQTGSAYLIGLCHDLGEILFHSHFGHEYGQILQMQQATGRRRDELEGQMLGVTHGELVQTILQCLGLPEEIRLPITSFHETGASRAAHEPLARLLQVADMYATGTLLASSEHSPLRPLTRPEIRHATGRDDPPRLEGVPLRAEIYSLTAMLARLSAKDEAKLMEPLYPHKAVKVMLVRDRLFSPFDPIAAALESLADVVVHDTLPTAAELTAYLGLIVVARSTATAGFTEEDIRRAVPAIGDKPYPLLWLTGRIDEGTVANQDQLLPVLWPVPLSRLAAFVKGL